MTITDLQTAVQGAGYTATITANGALCCVDTKVNIAVYVRVTSSTTLQSILQLIKIAEVPAKITPDQAKLQTKDVTPSGKPCGCGKVQNLVNTGADLAKAAIATITGTYVSEECSLQRKKICSACWEKDSKGDRLYRANKDGRVSCGVPFEDDILREPTKEGCGCYLELKWKVKGMQCPFGKWPSEDKK